MNLPNKLTMFRIILVPIFVLIGYLGMLGIISCDVIGIPVSLIIMDVIFIIASITDTLDGQIARKRNLVTTFGKFADPLADKILVLAALVMLVELDKIPAWIPIVVLFREFLVSGYRLIAVEKGGQVIAASIWGKLKTVTQMIAIVLIFVDKFNFCQFLIGTTDEIEAVTSSIKVFMTMPELIFNGVTSVLLFISVVATIFSGWDYLKGGKELFKDN